MKDLTLSVIMPALDEGSNIEEAINRTLKAFRKFNIEGEIIVVNDGSRDNTRQIVEKLQKKCSFINLINHDKPKGIGFSFFDGVKKSSNEIVVMFPGDNENNPENAINFFSLLNYVDIVVPFIYNIEVRSKKRRIISSFYRFIINMSFGINLNYTNGTVFYRRCILNDIDLKSSGFFYQAELLIKLIRKGYLYAEVPNLLSSNSSISKATTLKSLVHIIKDYLILFFEIHIKRIEAKKEYKKLNEKSCTHKKQQ